MQLSPFAVLQAPSLGQCVAIWSLDASEREWALLCFPTRKMRARQSWAMDLCVVEDKVKRMFSREDKRFYSKDSRSG